MTRRLAAFGAFWYDFVVGDDWRLAVGVVVALGLAQLLELAGNGLVGDVLEVEAAGSGAPLHLARVEQRRQRRGHVVEDALALLLVAGHLADQDHHRCAVLEGGVHTDRGVRRAGPARDEAEPRQTGQLAVGLGHVRGGAFVPARDEADRALVQPVEECEVALARHAERDLRAVDGELVGEQPAPVPHSLCSRKMRADCSFGFSASAGST